MKTKLRLRSEMFVFFFVAATVVSTLSANMTRAETIAVDPVMATGKTYGDAEKRAKTKALESALKKYGSAEIAPEAKNAVLADVERLVEILRVENGKKKNGIYSPWFFCEIDKTAMEAIIEKHGDTALQAMKRPRVNVAVLTGSLPEKYVGKKDFLRERANNRLEQHLQKAGFRIGTPPARLVRQLDAKDPQKAFRAFVKYATEVEYFLYGRLHILEEDIRPAEGGEYFKAKARIELRLHSVSSNEQAPLGTDRFGIGVNETESVAKAVGSCAQAAAEEAARIVTEDWDRKLKEGFEYSLMFCSFQDSAWTKNLRRELKAKGRFISKSRGDNATEIYRYQAAPGAFVFPSVDFEDFLLGLDGFESAESGVVLVGEKLYFVFGDDPQCLDIGFDASETSRSIIGGN